MQVNNAGYSTRSGWGWSNGGWGNGGGEWAGFDVVGEGLADAAEFESFEVNPALGADFLEVGRGPAEGGADLGLQSAAESALVAGAVQVIEQFSDLEGEFLGSAEVEPMLASLIAVGQLVVGAESFAAIGSPGGGERALAGEDLGVCLDEFLDALEAGSSLLVLANGIAFFRVWGSG